MSGEVYFNSPKISEYFHKQSQRPDYDLISQKPSPNKSAQKPSKEKSKPKYYVYEGRKFRIHYNPKTKEKYIMYFEYKGKKRDVFYHPESKCLYIMVPSVVKTEFIPVELDESEIVEKRYICVNGKEYEVFWDIWQKSNPRPCIFKTGAEGRKEMVYIDKKDAGSPQKYTFVNGKRFNVYIGGYEYDEKTRETKIKYVYYSPLEILGDKPVVLKREDREKIKRVKIPEK